MKDHSIYMKSDQRPHHAPPLDLSPLLGEWFTTNPATLYLAKLHITRQEDQLLFRGYGAGDDGLIDWGTVPATPFASGTTEKAGGFLANYALDGIETQLAANYKLGVMVIQSYTTYQDGSGRAPHFGREFFHR